MYYMIFARWQHSQISAGSKRENGDKKYSIFARWQHLILTLFGGGLHMCICCCMYAVYVCAYVRVKVMFEVCGSESESMSDQYGILLCLQPFIKHIAFRRMTASMLTFLIYVCVKNANASVIDVLLLITSHHFQTECIFDNEMSYCQNTDTGLLGSTSRVRVAISLEFVGIVQIYSSIPRFPTCVSRDSTNVPTFKLTVNYLNFASKSNIGIIIDILPCQIDSSILNSRTNMCHRRSSRINVIIKF